MSEHNDKQELEQEVELRPQDQEDGEFVKIPRKDHENMRKQLKKANGEAKTYREQLQQYRQYADDPNDLEELIALKERFEQQGDEGGKQQQGQDEDAFKERLNSQLAKQRKEIEKRYQTQLEQLQSERKELERTLENTVLMQKAESVILREKGTPELLMPEILKRAKAVKEGDRFIDRVFDESGEIDFNDRGEYKTIDDLVQELKQHQVYGRAFDAPVKSGSGQRSQSDGGSRGAKQQFDVTRSQLKGAARQKFIAEHGEEAFFALKP